MNANSDVTNLCTYVLQQLSSVNPEDQKSITTVGTNIDSRIDDTLCELDDEIPEQSALLTKYLNALQKIVDTQPMLPALKEVIQSVITCYRGDDDNDDE